jgi:hypothetical protein
MGCPGSPVDPVRQAPQVHPEPAEGTPPITCSIVLTVVEMEALVRRAEQEVPAAREAPADLAGN